MRRLRLTLAGQCLIVLVVIVEDAVDRGEDDSNKYNISRPEQRLGGEGDTECS